MTEAQQDAAETAYIAHVDTHYGEVFAKTVGRFQEGLLADKVTNDPDEAFVRAVNTTLRLLPAIKIKARAGA